MPPQSTIKNDQAVRLGLARYPAAGHWANAQCKAWWIALPGLTGGPQWYDVLGQYPWTVSYWTYTSSGASQRPTGYWSPTYSNGNYGGNLADGYAPRPGALSGTFFGPLQWGYGQGAATQHAYGSSNLNLNTVCPTAGTIALWHRPTYNYNNLVNNDIWFYQGGGQASGNFLAIHVWSGVFYTTFYLNSTFYQEGKAPTSSVWSLWNWNHWTITWQAGGKINIYVNGQLWVGGNTTLPSTLNILTTPYLLTLGAMPGATYSRFSTSCFDDVSIWSYPMTPQQVQQVYQQSSQGWPGRLESRPPRVIRRAPVSVSLTGTGGLTEGGASNYKAIFAPTPSGGLTEGGRAGATVRFAATASGGESFGGHPVAGLAFHATASGGESFGGHPAANLVFRVSPSGGESFGGHPAPAAKFSIVPDGGITQRGHVTLGHIFIISPSGGLSLGGPAVSRFSFHVAAAGGVAQGGHSQVAWATIVHPSGGLSLGGSLPIQDVVYHVYANTGVSDPIDYSAVIAVVGGLTWTSTALAYPGDWKFGVRAFSQATNLEEQNIDAVVKIVLNAAGSDTSRVPPPPLGLSALALAGGSLQALWTCPCSDHDRLPTGFHVYLGAGTSPDYSAPVATALYSSGRMGTFSAVVNGLAHGASYAVAVRAFNAVGEEANTIIVMIKTDGAPPELVDALSAVATNQDH